MTEATPTIVERLNALRLTAFSAGGFSTPETKTYYSELSKAFQNGELVDASEITRLQSELNTALERVKELEEAHRKIASTPYCGFAITSGLSRSDLEELVGTFWKEFETRVSISSAVLQSSGGK